ncbi:MAG: CerR family C-terminal domain-containing protein [Planctomycetota bacterium]
MAGSDERLRERLLDAALHLFAEHGRDGVSLREIALEAGATHGSIRHHFGTKDNLYISALMRIRSMDLLVDDGANDRPGSVAEGEAALKEMVSAFLDFQARIGSDHVAALGLIRAEVARDGGPDPVFYERIIRPGHEKLKLILQSIRPDIEDDETLEILAFNIIFQCVMVRIGRGIVLKRLRKRTLNRKDRDRIAYLIIETTLCGLRTLEA